MSRCFTPANGPSYLGSSEKLCLIWICQSISGRSAQDVYTTINKLAVNWLYRSKTPPIASESYHIEYTGIQQGAEPISSLTLISSTFSNSY